MQMKYVAAIAALVGAPLSMAQLGLHQISHPLSPVGGLICSAANPVADSMVSPVTGQLASATAWLTTNVGDVSTRNYRLRVYLGTTGVAPGTLAGDFSVGSGTLQVVVEGTPDFFYGGGKDALLRFSFEPVDVSAGQTVWIALSPGPGEDSVLWVAGTGGNGHSARGNDGGFESVSLQASDRAMSVSIISGPAPETCPDDITGDGVVNFADLNSLLNNFGSQCE